MTKQAHQPQKIGPIQSNATPADPSIKLVRAQAWIATLTWLTTEILGPLGPYPLPHVESLTRDRPACDLIFGTAAALSAGAPCPVLSCPVLSCPVLSCPVLSCPVFQTRNMSRVCCRIDRLVPKTSYQIRLWLLFLVPLSLIG
ncbi:hypothetical protein VTL71DRAFT_1874 [Oculimacula yallundae]|uniref:Uncharacterized protein n=1 Tax=Oculimacula yallundae TaxID=86028 RepID=A0ABR4CBY0_9HELO